jgi:hypothetical protein
MRASYDRRLGTVSWADAALPNEISSVALRPPPCPVLTSTSGLWTVAEGAHTGVTFVAPISEQAAAVGIEVNGAFEWFLTDSTGPHALSGWAPAAFARGVGDDVWFTAGGAPFHAVVSSTAGAVRATPVQGLPPGAFVGAVAASSGPATEVFWADILGRIFRYDGSAFTLIGSTPAPATLMISSAPGEAFAIEPSDPKTIFHITTRVQAEQLEVARVISLASIAGVGVLAGSNDGALYLRDQGGQWSTLGSDRLGYWVLGAAPSKDAVIMLLSSGSLGAYQHGRYCDQLFSFGSVLPTGAITSVGSRIFFAGYDDTTQRVRAGFIVAAP